MRSAPRTAPTPEPPDPTGAATPVEFAGRLRALMTLRRRSLDTVARYSRQAGTPISRATVHNLITAASTPRQESLLGFLRGCGVPPPEQIRWLITFHEVYPDTRALARLREARLRQAAPH